MSAPEPVVNVEQVMREIRERVYRRGAAVSPGAQPDSAGSPVFPVLDFMALRQAANHAARCAGLVGEMPPAPATWRARAGALFVRLVRRMLFWYTPQIAQYQQASARALRDQVDALERLSETIRITAASLHARLDQVEQGLRDKRE